MSRSLAALCRAYCFACIVSGVFQMFVPVTDTKKIIKLVSALYIISSVLTQIPKPDALSGVYDCDSEVPAVTVRKYEAYLLEAIEEKLAVSFREKCEANNICASADFRLQAEEGHVVVQEVIVECDNPAACEVLYTILQEYAPHSIQWKGECCG